MAFQEQARRDLERQHAKARLAAEALQDENESLRSALNFKQNAPSLLQALIPTTISSASSPVALNTITPMGPTPRSGKTNSSPPTVPTVIWPLDQPGHVTKPINPTEPSVASPALALRDRSDGSASLRLHGLQLAHSTMAASSVTTLTLAGEF